jgi:hypothetical protein
LELAELFSGRPTGPAGDEIISKLVEGNCGEHLRICPWTSPSQLASLLPKVIAEELGVDETDLEKSFALQALGGNESNGSVYFNFWSSGPAADRWQVLSPVKGEAAGTLILNRLIQSGFRAETKKRAQQQDRRFAKVAAPMGATESFTATRSSTLAITAAGMSFRRRARTARSRWNTSPTERSGSSQVPSGRRGAR